MQDFSKLIDKLNAQADNIEQLEEAFMRMTASRVMDYNKSKSIAGSIIILFERFKEYNRELGNELDVEGVAKGFVTFLLEKEESLILGILADVFSVDREDAGTIPFSCIYECIFKDRVVRDFLGVYANAAMKKQSNMSATAVSPSPPIPSTSKPGGKKTLTGSNLKEKR